MGSAMYGWLYAEMRRAMELYFLYIRPKNFLADWFSQKKIAKLRKTSMFIKKASVLGDE